MERAGRRRARHLELLLVLVPLAALAVTVPRLYPTMAALGDSPELVTAATVFGVPHPPGYPLYVAIGHAAVRLGLGDAAWTLHLTSAVFHAATVALVASVTATLTGSVACAAASGLGLLLARSFLLGSLYAEVFPLNDLFFALLLLLGLRVSRAEPEVRARRTLAGMAVVGGLASAHQQMIVLAAPALALLLGPSLYRCARVRPGLLGLLALLFVVPVAGFYALVPVAAARDQIISWGEVKDLSALVHLATRQDYGGLLRASRRAAEGQLLERLDAFFVGIGRSVGPVGLVCAAVGAGSSLVRFRREGGALLAAFAVSGPLFAAMNAVDIHSEARLAFFERFTTMCHVPLAILIGCGVHEIERRVLASYPRAPVGGLLAAAVIVPLWGHLSVDFSQDRLGRAYAHDLVLGTPDRSLVLLTGDMPGHAALYVCGVERACGGRIVLSPLQLHLPWKMAQVRRRYPDLDLPIEGGGALDVAAMIDEALRDRPVFVHPELLQKRPTLAARFAWSAELLLLRARPKENAGEPVPPEPIAMAPRCEACDVTWPELPRPSMEAAILKGYEEAFAARANARPEDRASLAREAAKFRIPPWRGP